MKMESLAILFLTVATYLVIAGPAFMTRTASMHSLEERPKLLEGRLDRVAHRVHDSMNTMSATPEQYVKEFNAQELTFTPQFVGSPR